MPKHLTFFKIVKPAKKITFIIQWYQECPSLVPCGLKVDRPYSAAYLRWSATTGSPHSICPNTSPFLELSNQPEKSLLLFTDIKNALVWCHVVQKWVGGSLQHFLGGVQPRDQPYIHLQCPNKTRFSELSNQPETSLFIFHWFQECPSLLPCGPKVGRR